MASFSLRDIMSAERLINACRWFEDIPVAKSRDALSKDDINSIANAAAGKASELGYEPDIRMRIANAIKRIKSETSEEHFKRLVGTVSDKLGKSVLKENAVEHLKRAKQFRGKSAHGHFNPASEEEFFSFCESVRAMEALCYLLTAIDLPIPKNGIARLRSNPVVRDYIHTQY